MKGKIEEARARHDPAYSSGLHGVSERSTTLLLHKLNEGKTLVGSDV
jgi:hypothetical protein